MAIPIACEECHRAYKVDDKLAGKKVKCKGCGNLIRVPGEAAPVDDELRDCLSCGSPMQPGTRICGKCGFNITTGQKESLLLEEQLDKIKKRGKRQYVRKPGNPTFESLDELIKLLLTLPLVAGIVMTIVHIFRFSTDGFTFAAILPTIVILVAFIGIVAPLAALAVNITVRAMKLANRDDTYVRIVLCLLLPFSAGMIVGWPETRVWDWIATLAWPVAILLLIYMLRADVFEWMASLVAAVAAIALSLIVVNLLGGAINDIAGNMYADMLPPGPWTILAKGHSPVPPLPATVASTKGVQPFPSGIADTQPTPATNTAVTTSVAVATQDTPATQIAVTTTTAPVATTTTAAAPHPLPLKMSSPFFASVIDDPAIRDAAAVVAPIAPADWMLTIKNTDTTTEVDRWSLNPLEKKEHLSYPYFAKKSPQFAISPKGDAVAALTFFPRRQLDVVPYDGKSAKRTIVLDLPANLPEGATAAATPSLLGILDPARYYLRWDMGGMSVLQLFAAPAGGTGPALARAAQLGAVADYSPPLLAPNGRTTAVFGRNQILFGNVDNTAAPKPILVASDPNVRLLGFAFSADSSQIAVYAAIADLPTLMAFQLKNGEPVFTSLLSQTPLDKDVEVMPHALVWLPGAAALLINGTDLADSTTGKKFATLGIAGLTDAQLVSASTVAFTFKSSDGAPHTILAKLDDTKIRPAKLK